MASIWAFLLVIGILIFIHELGHFAVAKWRRVRVERFSLGFPPRLFGFKKGDTDYCVSAIPLGGYVKMAGENPDENAPEVPAPDDFMAKSLWERAAIIAAGPAMNYILAFVLYAAIIGFGGRLEIVDNGLRVGELTEGWPAQTAGLLPGDLILAVDGQPLQDFDALRAHVGKRAGQKIVISALRGGDTLSFELVPKLSPDPQTGIEEGKIGIFPGTEFVDAGFVESIKTGAEVTLENTAMVGQFFVRLVSGKESPRNVGGPLFIASIAGEVAQQGWRHLLGFMAILSINLAILNILPIPALDGGQLVFILIERLKGKPLSLKQRMMVQQVGLAFLLVLIIFVTINDIVRVLS
jgi:regulator of sigma E protease